MRSSLLLALAALCFAGCASTAAPAWTKTSATDADAAAALARCRDEASKVPLTPKGGVPRSSTDPNAAGASGTPVSSEDMVNYRRSVNDCMGDAGWSRRR